MTLKQTCEYLSISEATGRNWIKQGRLTPNHYDEKKGNYFAPDSIKKLKENLQQTGKLTKRRNKTAICLPSAYTNYLNCDEAAAKQLDHVIAYCQEAGAPLLKTIAHYAEEFFRSANTLHQYAPLINDLRALAPNQEELSDYPALPFLPYEDLLGYLYISLTQLDKRKKSGIYYTPSSLAKRLIDHTTPLTKDINIYFDPACGTGNFLLQILSYAENNAKNGCQNKNQKIQLIGQDTDPAAIAIARINIALNAPDTDIDILRENIRVADSLLHFPSCKNTLIFGNPPWGASLPSRKHSGAKDSAALFVQNSIRHQSDNGVISFLLPASLFTAGRHREMRKTLLENTRMISIDYLMQSFTLVNCPSVILTLQKDRQQPGIHRCDVYKKTEHYTIQNRIIPNPSYKSTHSADYFPMLHADDASYALFCKLDSLGHAVRLKGAADFALGIVTGDNRRFLIPSGTDHAHISTEPIIRGFNLNKYRLHGPFDQIRYTPEIFQQCAKEELYRAKEKLLYRFIGKTPVFSYDNHGYLTLNSCNILIPHIDGLDIKYILAVLNSDIATFYWRTGFDSVKLLKSHIETLPIPIASVAQQQRIVSLVDKILTEEQNYDIITAEEKQATRSGICFSAVINEKAFDEVKHGVRKHGLSSLDDIFNNIEKELSQLYGLTEDERSLIRKRVLN
ncbi:MAG: N-6 DNA methylase [Lachnospiraceae bacterium]|nr:N-6 DNA methylase [Lachnospiraceae bacterium]